MDNASSNDVVVANFKKKMAKWDTSIMNGQYLHMRCVVHIINLVVQNGLKDLNESITRVRDAVRYFKQSPTRLRNSNNVLKWKKLNIRAYYRWTLQLDGTPPT